MSDLAHITPLLAQLGQLSKAKVMAELGVLGALFFKPGSSFSVFSLLSAALIALVAMAVQRHARGRRFNPKLMLRALFPRWLLRSASTKSDMGFFLLNVFAVSGLIGWGLLNFGAVSHWTQAGLTGMFGRRGASGLPPWAIQAIMTVTIFLVYELAYWLDHYLSHAVPFLWEFHRVHHTAETLTPLTVFRVHPVDTLKFFNIVTVLTGLASGLAGYLVGGPVSDLNVQGANIILLLFIFLTVHLQHSHVWIAFTGGWGRVLASPAHHQIHHSADPAHFGKNLGSCLALWDWVFGTLRLPTRAREPLVYGVEPGQVSPHTITGGLITPFARALTTLKPKWRTPEAAGLPLTSDPSVGRS